MTDAPHPTPDLDREGLIRQFNDRFTDDRYHCDSDFAADMVLAHVAADRARRVEVTDAMVERATGAIFDLRLAKGREATLQDVARAALTAALNPAEPDVREGRLPDVADA